MTVGDRLVLFFALLLLALPASAEEIGDREHEQFLSLELLDRNVVVENRVRVVTTAISKADSNQEDSSGSCLVESFEFDRNGNLVLHSPPLLGSDYYYSYNENNELVDFGRIDSDGGTHSLAEYLGEVATLIQVYEAPRVNYESAILRSVSSLCFNIDAEYQFSHSTGNSDLPKSADAHKFLEMNSGVFPEGRELRSPDELHVKYSYEIWKTP